MRAVLMWLPLLIFSTAAVVLALFWGELPPRWPIHWGIGGHADGWATRTPIGVFGPLLMGLVIWLCIEALLRVMRAGQRGQHATASMAEALRFTEIALALTFAIVSIWMPLGRPNSPLGMIVVSLVIMMGGIIASMLQFLRLRPVVSDPAVTSDEGWNGFVYRNPKDHRLWVPKRSGLGWTLNFSHRLAWITLVLLLTPAFISVVAVIVIAARSR